MPKTVMVHLSEHGNARPVTFEGGKEELIAGIKTTYEDLLAPTQEFSLQIQDAFWGNFVDLFHQEIKNLSHINVLIKKTLSVTPQQLQEAAHQHSSSQAPAQGSMAVSTQARLSFRDGQLVTVPGPPICSDVATLDSHNQLRNEDIRKGAIIYSKETSRPLSSYQKRMNEAAQDLAVENPGLLTKRKKLMEAARTKIMDDGFQFVKGKSRSKKGLSGYQSEAGPSRKKTSQEIRDNRMKEIEEELKDTGERIRFKENRISANEAVKDYKKCDEIMEDVTTLKQRCRELKAEKLRLSKSNSQSKWYYGRKNTADTETETSTSTTADVTTYSSGANSPIQPDHTSTTADVTTYSSGANSPAQPAHTSTTADVTIYSSSANSPAQPDCTSQSERSPSESDRRSPSPLF